MFVVLNDIYAIRNERNCSYIVKKNGVSSLSQDNIPSIIVIPPFLGYILSQIGQLEFELSIGQLSTKLKINIEVLEIFIKKILENPNPLKIKFKYELILPSKLLVKSASSKTINYPEEYLLNEFIPQRPKLPISINYMVTTKCSVNCVYCYANRNLATDLDIKQVKQLLVDIYESGVINLTLTGGDIFAHAHWKEILNICKTYKFNLFISTKTPIDLDGIIFLKDIGVTEIQFSIDSITPFILENIIGSGSGYIEKVLFFIRQCEINDISINIRTVLTSLNDDINSIESMYQVLSQFSNISQWVITPAFYSYYNNSKDNNIQIDNNRLMHIYEKMNRIENPRIDIVFSKTSEQGYSLSKFDTKESFIESNQICNANSYSMSILANGLCTVCEMLYDNPTFLIGDLKKDTLSSIWNSEKALELYRLKQDNAPKDSPCASCHSFSDCRNKLDKRVCYVDVAKVYKHEKSVYFPDPRCPESIDTDLFLLL